MAAPGVGGVLPASFKELIGLDARGLTLLRVCLGLTVLVDALARLPNACFHFADSGLISRTLLFDNMHFAMWNVNVFAATGACYPVLFLFVVYAASAFSLAIGYFTRFCTFLCWVFVMSMQHRNPAVHDSGDFYLRMVLFWSMFLPLGARGGVDAFLCRTPESYLQMAHRFTAARAPTADVKRRADGRARSHTSPLVASAGTMALILQVVILYLASFFWKTGDDWKVTLNATQMSLQLEHFALPAGRILRRFPLICKGLTGMTLLAEGPLSLLFLLGGPSGKFAVALLFISFHLGLGCAAPLLPAHHQALTPRRSLTMHLGHFPWHCMAALVAFVPASAWDAFEQRLAAKPSRAGHRLWLAPHIEPSSLTARVLDAVAAHCMLGSSWATARAMSAWEASPAHPVSKAFAALPSRHAPTCMVETPGGAFVRGWPAVRALLAASPLLWPLSVLVPASWGSDAETPAPGKAGASDAAGREYAALARGARNDLLRLAASAAMTVPAGDARNRMLSDLVASAAHSEAGQQARGAGSEARESAHEAAVAVVEPMILPVVERATRWEPVRATQRRLLSAVVTAFVTFCTVFVVLHNADTIMKERPVYGLKEWAPGKIPGVSPGMEQLLRLTQKWDMFAPYPLRWDPWFVIPATLTDGREVDLWPTMPHNDNPVPISLAPNVSWADPGPLVLRTGSKQWHRYWHTTWKKRRSWMRRGLAKWICRRFQEVKFLRIVAMAPHNMRPGVRTKPYRVSLWTHYCRAEYKEEYDAMLARDQGRFIKGSMPKVKSDAQIDKAWSMN